MMSFEKRCVGQMLKVSAAFEVCFVVSVRLCRLVCSMQTRKTEEIARYDQNGLFVLIRVDRVN